MYPRIIEPPDTSFFLFGPRGTGKSSWLRANFPEASYIDLLDNAIFRRLLSSPEDLQQLVLPEQSWVVIDEVQKLPALLDEVHRLIELKRIKFALSGSSARKLKRSGTNLLAGRAITKFLHGLSVKELGASFSLEHALRYGMLPTVWNEDFDRAYLDSYVTTYLKEEVQQEGLTRNLGTFSRFLEVCSFSQASPINVTAIGRECGVDNKTAENYITILEDLLLAVRVPVFSKQAKRNMYTRAKFYFFDAGVFRSIRPKGPLDTPEFIDGAALETLVLQELRAIIENQMLDLRIYYWRTRDKLEVDFVLYGENGLYAIEVKRSSVIRSRELRGLLAFLSDYPMAKAIVLYNGKTRESIDGVELLPIGQGIGALSELLES